MDKKEKRKKRIYLLINLIMGIVAVVFISSMGYLNYKTTAIELKEQVLVRIEADTVDVMETALRFGKRIDNYYGTDEIFASFRKQTENTFPFVINDEGKLLYIDSEYDTEIKDRISKFLVSSEFSKALADGLPEEAVKLGSEGDRAILYPILQDEEVAGYFACLYSRSGFKDELADVRKEVEYQTLIVALVLTVIL
ncbi:MAG: hypothetical protein K6E19_11115, partial [Lachnospiraceae bacterium]|nr:hypothetical protein [Lachnospiraceae bacterium]